MMPSRPIQMSSDLGLLHSVVNQNERTCVPLDRMEAILQSTTKFSHSDNDYIVLRPRNISSYENLKHESLLKLHTDKQIPIDWIELALG
jgi:hypothetical protein